MTMSDTIADMLTRIRNAQHAKLISMPVPHSAIKISILEVLQEEGYISSFKVADVRKGIKSIEVKLKYSAKGDPAIKEIKKVSKPGRRVYSSVGDLPEYYSGMGVYILSTSNGVISDRKASALGVGGEVICKVF